jgi:geranylgeranyl diphosphate synthase type I
MIDLKTYFSTHLPDLKKSMEEMFRDRRKAASLYTPHLVQSVDILEDFAMRGGKMIRSTLVLLAYQLAGGEITPAIYQVAAGVELFHKHILNLDDMADRDEMRNGGPTVWKKYQEVFSKWENRDHHARSFSEIDGTLLGSFAIELVRRADIPPEKRLAVIDVLMNKMYFETVAGWQIHYYQNQEPLSQASEDEFLRGLDLVTSRYTFVGPLKIGLLLAGVERGPSTDAMKHYGLDVGLAFQITDDILGLFGDPSETGKAVGNDVREGKKTLLLQRAYKSAPDADKKFLVDVCGRELSAGELERVQKIVKETGSLDYSLKLAEEHITKAVKELKNVKVKTEAAATAQQVLSELAEFVGNRKK